MTVAYIGLGSNLDDPSAQIDRAMSELDRIPETKLLAKSSKYLSAPVGPANQPDYINAAAKLKTGLTANILLRHLQEIEDQHGRRREVRWGPRTLDLDILLYGDSIINEPDLKIPHCEIDKRHFVLYPLIEIDKDLDVPGLGRVDELFRHLDCDPPQRIVCE